MDQTRYWIETRWLVPKGKTEEWVARLGDLGCLGSAEIESPHDAEHPNREVALIAYFPDRPDLEFFKEQLLAYQSRAAVLISLARIPEGDWATAWKAYFKPFALAPGLIVRPSWEEYTAQAFEQVIVLDPGMAFGTGQHESTRFCAEFLVELRKSNPEFQSLLDVGCGSGILSLSAARLGFCPVIGIDNDPLAICVALENRERNPDLSHVEFSLCDEYLKPISPLPLWERVGRGGIDVIVANIIAETLCEIKPVFLDLLNPGGILILSGIVLERQKMIESCFQDHCLLSKKESVEWAAYLYRKE